LSGDVRLRVREIIKQVCFVMGVTNITEDVVMAYLNRHIGKEGFSHSA
jgi:hypothetical protein